MYGDLRWPETSITITSCAKSIFSCARSLSRASVFMAVECELLGAISSNMMKSFAAYTKN